MTAFLNHEKDKITSFLNHEKKDGYNAIDETVNLLEGKTDNKATALAPAENEGPRDRPGESPCRISIYGRKRRRHIILGHGAS